MQYQLIGQILIDASILITIAAAIAVIVQFFRTRNIGFLWLLAAIFVWPRIGSAAVRGVIQRFAAHQPITWYPAKLVQQGKIPIGNFILSMNAVQEAVTMVLLLVAIFYLGRKTFVSSPSQAQLSPEI